MDENSFENSAGDDVDTNETPPNDQAGSTPSTDIDDLPDRYAEKIVIDGDCWIWIGCRDSHGYGHCRRDGKTYRVHRLIFEWIVGPIPPGLYACHQCDRPSCCNPFHLRIGTQQDNMMDMWNRGRGKSGENHCRAKLSDQDIAKIRELGGSGLPARKIAEMYPTVGERHIRKVLAGETRKK